MLTAARVVGKLRQLVFQLSLSFFEGPDFFPFGASDRLVGPHVTVHIDRLRKVKATVNLFSHFLLSVVMKPEEQRFRIINKGFINSNPNGTFAL